MYVPIQPDLMSYMRLPKFDNSACKLHCITTYDCSLSINLYSEKCVFDSRQPNLGFVNTSYATSPSRGRPPPLDIAFAFLFMKKPMPGTSPSSIKP